MKTIFTKAAFIVLSILFPLGVKAQNLCNGTPGSNSIIPLSQTVCAGSSATLGLAMNYTNSGISYQWHNSTVSAVGPWLSINGATSENFTSPPLNTTTFFMVVITCTNSGLSISLTCSVTVVPCATPCNGAPSSTSILPVSHSICAGDVANLTLSNTYTESGITYQWGTSTSPGGPFTAIPGATLSNYTSPPLNSNTYYNVVVTCTNSSLSYSTTHAVSVVNCTYCAGTPSSNSVLPLSHTICSGGTATMSLANSYTASGITISWLSSSVSPVGPFNPSPGGTFSTYTSPTLTNTTFYNVVITCTNSNKSITVPHTVTVIDCSTTCTGAPAATTIMPVSQTICAGSTANLSLSTTYTDSGITYQWENSSTPFGPYTVIPNATLSTYSSPALNTTTYYKVIVTCTASGMNYTAVGEVAVIQCTACSGAPASNTILPLTYSICSGNSASLSLANTYSASGITYQWQSSSVSLAGPFTSIPGATLSTYTSPLLTSTMYYNVIITCTNGGQTFSTSRMVTVLSCTTPCSGAPASNTILPLNHTICVGNNAVMTLANSYFDTGITYQWGSASSGIGPFTAIPNATANAYTSPALNTTTFYNVVIACANSGLDFSTVHEVQVLPCGLDGISSYVESQSTIFPNPGNGEFTIEFRKSIDGELSVWDVTGRKVHSLKIDGQRLNANLSHLPNGIYYLEIDRVPAGKIVIQKKE